MASVLVDTNVLIRYFRGDEPFAELIETSESVIVHPVVYAEYMSGLDESRKKGKMLRKRLEEFLDAPPVILADVSTTTSLYYSKIYKALKGSGRMIPQNDAIVIPCNHVALAEDAPEATALLKSAYREAWG